MIECSGLRIPLGEVQKIYTSSASEKQRHEKEAQLALELCLKGLGFTTTQRKLIQKQYLTEPVLHKRSIDARKHRSIYLIYSIRFACKTLSELKNPSDYSKNTEDKQQAAHPHRKSARNETYEACASKEGRLPQLTASQPQAVLFESEDAETTFVAFAKQQLTASKRKPGFSLKLVEELPFALPVIEPKLRTKILHDSRPVVVGAGCAGLFCALTLAEAGLSPLLIERGENARRRSKSIEHFYKTGELKLESNIQFGLGGAGTFSDGKLATGTKSPAHSFILQTLVRMGAPESILYDAHPHVGSDILQNVVENIAKKIQALGGEIWFDSRLVDLKVQDAKLQGIHVLRRYSSTHNADKSTTESPGGASAGSPVAAALSKAPAAAAAQTCANASTQTTTEQTHEVEIPCTHLVLCCGHSARDIFELIKARGIFLERKTFAMGFRIEHPQELINKAHWGSGKAPSALGPSPYKFAQHLPNGRTVFSFCMCPGGMVVAAASENDGVVTNGMSFSDRALPNANAGILANVFSSDLEGDDVLAGVRLQRLCEQTAFIKGGGAHRAPAQLMADFLCKQPSSSQGSVTPSYPRGVSWTSLDSCLPSYLIEAIRAALPSIEHKISGFTRDDAVLTGVETRSSSPVRITRDKDGQSINCEGLFPAGEGAGYAGGIMSAATDGIRAAESLIARLKKSHLVSFSENKVTP